MPKDENEPDWFQKQYFFEETECCLFLIGLPCFTHYECAACLPEVTSACIEIQFVQELEYAGFPKWQCL